MSEDGMLEQSMRNTIEHLMELWERIDAPDPIFNNYTDDPDDVLTSDEAREEMDELPLSVTWQKGVPFEVLLAFGGPNIWIECDARYDRYVLKGGWAGDYAEMTDPWSDDAAKPITRTGEYFRALVDMDEE